MVSVLVASPGSFQKGAVVVTLVVVMRIARQMASLRNQMSLFSASIRLLGGRKAKYDAAETDAENPRGGM